MNHQHARPGPRPGRRQVLRGAVAAAGTASLWGLAGRPAHADRAAAPGGRVAARQLGRFEVLALLDAHGTFPGTRQEAFPTAGADDWQHARELDPAAFGPGDTWELDFRCYAVRGPGGRVTLVDTGVGPVGSPASGWAPVPGRLPQVLAAAGIAPGDVTAVVLTHLHEDHYGWSVLPDGTPVFPDARYLVQRAEVAALAETRTAMTYVVTPLRRAGLLREVDGRVRLPGTGPACDALTLLPTPGHTPGHQSLLVDGGGHRLVVTGDVLVHAVQLADPAVAYAYELDPALARRSREELLAEARRTRAVLATAHLNQPFVRLPGPPPAPGRG
ncbi:MBL fold metallo-hydrolase [Kitasatospora sp. NPDC058170]|uniref:MBL fold metallo-hydrolase n=1 Tax=Kitasatospora sp. NPDC058170 TaxID=3346364 RepID=UPI0036DB9B62